MLVSSIGYSVDVCLYMQPPSVQPQDMSLWVIQCIWVISRVSHYTHDLYIYKGLVYCNVCGNRGSNNQIRKLAKPCNGSPLPNTCGALALAATRDGCLPPRLDQWPE